MDILLVRHGESEANALGRLQGHLDSPLSERGREQARIVADWLSRRRIGWDVAYTSPLLRARETAEILTTTLGAAPPTLEPDLKEIHAGRLEGLTRDEMAERHPEWVTRSILDLGDFSDFGGESYGQIQARVEGLIARLVERHRASAERVLVVGHGGVNFQLIKALVCRPVPKVCILRIANCAATWLHLRDRRGTFIGELVWHIPVELMGEVETADTGAPFR
jgi:broad specificity phosphatase PhoE